jgi:hypothetical protein
VQLHANTHKSGQLLPSGCVQVTTAQGDKRQRILKAIMSRDKLLNAIVEVTEDISKTVLNKE